MKKKRITDLNGKCPRMWEELKANQWKLSIQLGHLPTALIVSQQPSKLRHKHTISDSFSTVMREYFISGGILRYRSFLVESGNQVIQKTTDKRLYVTQCHHFYF
jgi:hypothetical protein